MELMQSGPVIVENGGHVGGLLDDLLATPNCFARQAHAQVIEITQDHC